jgi:ABC-type amino acid transport system permease subunit
VIRLLAVALAVIGLVTGVTILTAAVWAAFRGVPASLLNPAVPLLLVQAALPAATLALLPGLAAATAIRHASGHVRLLVFGIAICLLLLPAPLLTGWPGADALMHGDAGRLPCAVVRGAILVMLITAPAIAAITPGLRRAARMAGATPFRAWRHVVLAQLWRPACLGWLAAAAVALAQTAAIDSVAAHLDLRAIWLILASLLLIACSTLALAAPRRPKPARPEPAGQPYLQ